MYSESERSWIAWVFAVVLLVCVVLYAFWGWEILENGWERGGTPFVLTFIPTAAILVLLTWANSTYFVREDGFGIQFGFKGWSKRVDYSDIIEAQEVEIRWTHWGGLGWRWRPGRVAYIVRNGRGIQIATNRASRFYTFNCRNCDALLTVFRKAGVPITPSLPRSVNAV